MKVTIMCESGNFAGCYLSLCAILVEGVYEDMPVTRYCMDVDEVKISGPGMDTITEEMYV